MYWYVVKIVYQIVCGNGEHLPQFDEQLRLINAVDRKEAWTKAREIGVQEQYAFRNQKNELVEWRFLSVPEVHAVDSLKDGAELYSRVEEPDNAKSYMALQQMKAAQLQTQPLLANA